MPDDPAGTQPRRNVETIETSLAKFERHSIGMLLQQLTRDFERRARGALRARGHPLQLSHQVVFSSLGRSGTRLTDLAQRAGMTKQAMGQIVDEIERLGYVERTPDPADGRAKIVRFTSAGFDLLGEAAEVIGEIWREYAALLGEEELDQLQSTLRKLVRGARRLPRPQS